MNPAPTKNPYRPGRRLRTLGFLSPGVARVQSQVRPFATYWDDANAVVLAEVTPQRPLWIALGDSMTQGIGAHSPTGGWVGRVQRRLAAAGHPHDVINLSVTGARIRDVAADQVERLHTLFRAADLVTVLIGSNDLLSRRRRATADSDYAELLDALNALSSTTVVATLSPRNSTAAAINRRIDTATRRDAISAADLRTTITWRTVPGTRAADFFHPNDRGYALIADAFAAALPFDLTPSVAGARSGDTSDSASP